MFHQDERGVKNIRKCTKLQFRKDNSLAYQRLLPFLVGMPVENMQTLPQFGKEQKSGTQSYELGLLDE